MASKLKIKVNGLVHNVTASLDTPLLYVLHNELHLHGPRFGCGLAQCGACSVLLDGKEIRSCVTPVAAVSGKAITTLEGMPALYAKSRGTTAATPACAASAAAGVDRRAGAALRLLPERNDDPGRRSAGDDEAPDRGADPHGDERPSVPLRHVSADPDGDPEGRRRDGEGWEVTMTEMLNKEFSRKSFLKGGGAMIVGFSLAGAGVAGKAGAAAPTPAGYNPSLTKLDSWLRINADNTVNVLTSQGDPGNGISTGFLMVAAEELDVDMSQMINGTSTLQNGQRAQHGERRLGRRPRPAASAARTRCRRTGHRIRAAAVAARAELLKLASAKLGVAGREPDGRARASSRAAASRSPTASSSAGSSSTST